MLKKIYTISVLIKNLLLRKKHYRLTFSKEAYSFWIYDFKHWGFDYTNLAMVDGADELCEALSKGKDTLTIDIIASKKKLSSYEGYTEYEGEDMSELKSFTDKYFYGRHYKATDENLDKLNKFWICPVTLFVLGRYPNYIYIKSF